MDDLDGVRNVSDVRERLTELDSLVRTVAYGINAEKAELEEIIAELMARVMDLEAGLGGAAADPPQPEEQQPPPPTPWNARATAQDWHDLADWVDWITLRYSPRLHLRVWPCWPLHIGVVEELAACRAAWLEAAGKDEETGSVGADLAYWHQGWLWPTLARLHDSYSFKNCEDQHSPDQPGPPTDRRHLPGATPAPPPMPPAPPSYYARFPGGTG